MRAINGAVDIAPVLLAPSDEPASTIGIDLIKTGIKYDLVGRDFDAVTSPPAELLSTFQTIDAFTPERALVAAAGAMGTDAADLYIGGAGASDVNAGSGNDLLHGAAGADELDGGAGNDILLGGDGSDWLVSTEGEDVIDGGAGNDVIEVADNPTVTLVFRRGSGHDIVEPPGEEVYAPDYEYADVPVLRFEGINSGDLQLIWDFEFTENTGFEGYGFRRAGDAAFGFGRSRRYWPSVTSTRTVISSMPPPLRTPRIGQAPA